MRKLYEARMSEPFRNIDQRIDEWGYYDMGCRISYKDDDYYDDGIERLWIYCPDSFPDKEWKNLLDMLGWYDFRRTKNSFKPSKGNPKLLFTILKINHMKGSKHI